MPYEDWFDQKPPGIFLAYRAAMVLPLDPAFAIRLSAALASALTCIALFALVLPLLGRVGAAFASSLLGLLSADPMLQGPIANTEIYMLPGMVAAAAVLVPMLGEKPVSWLRAGAVGALLGVATLFKPVAITNAPFFVIAVFVAAGREARWRSTLRFVLGAALGGATLWLLTVAWLAVRGAWPAFFDVFVLHNFEYAGQLEWSARGRALSHYVATFAARQAPAWGLAALGLVWLAARRAALPGGFLGGFLAVNLLGVSASGLFFPHYFQQALPAVAALASAAAFALPLAHPKAQSLRAGLVAAVAMLPLLDQAVDFWQITPEQATARIYPGNPFELMPAVAEEVARITTPEDKVFLFGTEPEILFRAQRVSASRYIYLFPLYGRYSRLEERKKELIEQIVAARPRVVGWMPNRMARGGELEGWFERYVLEHYRLHLIVVPAHPARGELILAGEDLAERAAGRSPWMMLFVRNEPTR